MITLEQQKLGTELLQTLVQKAWKSPEFKQQLVENPKKAIEENAFDGFFLTEKFNFVVEDQTDNNFIYFNLPAEPNLENLELTEDDLEMVAGGSGWCFTYTVGFACFSLFMAGFRHGQQDAQNN
jgi:hypothetical protein